MAAEAGVSIHTVNAAVDLLRERGILYTVPRLGTYVSKGAADSQLASLTLLPVPVFAYADSRWHSTVRCDRNSRRAICRT
jgi:DNA-binding transcriptional MocR family regulator